MVRGFLLAMIALLAACATITKVEQHIWSLDNVANVDARIALGEYNTVNLGPQDRGHVKVTGSGRCEAFTLSWGDGLTDRFTNVDFGAGGYKVFDHSYLTWPGTKALRATGEGSCVGSRTGTLKVFGPPKIVGIAAAGLRTTCTALTTLPPIRAGSKVSVSNNDASQRVNFDCAFGGCVYGPAGSTTVAGARMPFPGLKEFSLVLKVGQQVAQAIDASGATLPMTAQGAGPLEICLNDDNLSDNGGSWRVSVSVDEKLAR